MALVLRSRSPMSGRTPGLSSAGWLRRSLSIAVIGIAVLIPSGTALAATGDLTFSRLSEFSGMDAWTGVSSYGPAVYAGGYHGNHALLRRYGRRGQILWTRAVVSSSKSNAGILGVAADASGVYVAGFVGQHEEIGSPLHFDGNAFVSHYLHNGTLDWYQALDIPGATVATGIATFGSYIYVVGNVQEGDALGGPEAAFVRKITRDGVNVWTRHLHFDQTAFLELPLLAGVTATADGVYVAGEGWVANQNQRQVDVLVRMYDQEGAVQWTDLRLIGAETHGLAIAADGTGAYVVARASADEVDPKTGDTTRVPYGGFLLKYDPVDQFVWQRRVTEASSSTPGGVAVAQSGVWIAGTTKARLFNQPPPGTVPDPRGDAFVVRYSRAGAPLLERQYSDPEHQTGDAIAADDQGVYLVGEATGFSPEGSTGPLDGLLLGIEGP